MPQPRDYTVELIPEADGGFTVRVPALSEVVTYGATKAEAMANAAEAIELVLEVRLAEGDPIPDDVVPVLEKLTIAA
ncbi:MAG TPA: type II toxin-antitoxin system HicB family antitoxin [Mesorhizobium sp.]|jgi:antitoxin HicB